MTSFIPYFSNVKLHNFSFYYNNLLNYNNVFIHTVYSEYKRYQSTAQMYEHGRKDSLEKQLQQKKCQ